MLKVRSFGHLWGHSYRSMRPGSHCTTRKKTPLGVTFRAPIARHKEGTHKKTKNCGLGKTSSRYFHGQKSLGRLHCARSRETRLGRSCECVCNLVPVCCTAREAPNRTLEGVCTCYITIIQYHGFPPVSSTETRFADVLMTMRSQGVEQVGGINQVKNTTGLTAAAS